MNLQQARLKRGVRMQVSQCGGVDGAAATTQRSRSTAGDWMNLNSGSFPPLDCALALDEVAIAEGREATIIKAYARELDGVFVRLPDCAADPDSLAGLVMELTGALGDISQEMRAALGDGAVSAAEAGKLLDLQHEHDAVSAQLRMALTRIAQGQSEFSPSNREARHGASE